MPKSKIDVKSNFLKSPHSKQNFSSLSHNRKSKRLLFLLSILIILIFISLWGIFFGGFLNIKNYSVNGNIQVSSQDIIKIVEQKSKNKLILTVDPASIENDLLNKLSLLSYARITKVLPSTLNIEVKERSLALTIKTLDNIVLVSQEGSVIREVNSNEIKDNKFGTTSVIILSDEPKRAIGYTFDAKLVHKLLLLVNSLNENKFLFNSIIIDNNKNVSIASVSGISVLISLGDINTDVPKLVTDVVAVYNRLIIVNPKLKKIDARVVDRIAVS